ncbi:MAG: outer membrane protein assembly factor BamE [Pseudomonadota bacterium]
MSPFRLMCAAALALGLSACGPLYSNHGYIPPQEDLDQIVVGLDTRDTVQETLGSGGATSVLEDNALYFVRSRVRTVAMMEPEVIERNIVAVSFDNNGVVSNVETFGLERGQVVRLTRRVTDSSVAGKGFFGQLVGNIGRIGPINSSGL